MPFHQGDLLQYHEPEYLQPPTDSVTGRIKSTPTPAGTSDTPTKKEKKNSRKIGENKIYTKKIYGTIMLHIIFKLSSTAHWFSDWLRIQLTPTLAGISDTPTKKKKITRKIGEQPTDSVTGREWNWLPLLQGPQVLLLGQKKIKRKIGKNKICTKRAQKHKVTQNIQTTFTSPLIQGLVKYIYIYICMCIYMYIYIYEIETRDLRYSRGKYKIYTWHTLYNV